MQGRKLQGKDATACGVLERMKQNATHKNGLGVASVSR